MTPQVAVDPVLPGDITARARDLGPFESPFIWLAFATAAVAVLAAVIALAHRRRLRRWGSPPSASSCCWRRSRR